MIRHSLWMVCVCLVSSLIVLGAEGGEADKAKKKKKNLGSSANFEKLDTNKDNSLSRDEFNKIGELVGKGAKGKQLDKLFGKLDADNNGSISKGEFEKASELRKKKKKAN